jgi:hypothetical protein
LYGLPRRVSSVKPIALPGWEGYNIRMTQETFENTLRTLMRRRPFFPFTVELDNGERIEVDAPNSVAWGGGAAAFLNERGEPSFFACEQVKQFITYGQEIAS